MQARQEACEAGRRIVVGHYELAVDWWPTRGPAVPAASEYAGRYILPFLGPTSFLLGRTLAKVAGQARETLRPVHVPLAPLGEALGVGVSTGRSSILARSVGRLILFELARTEDERVLQVRTDWPLVDGRRLRLLPEWLRVEH
ncbi:MAG: hypothetical protein ACRDWD_01830, partial [Acidimicrobiia bacterium]